MAKTKKNDETLKIGVLRGQETSFPEALITNINKVSADKGLNVIAEFCKLGGTQLAEPSGYAVILDRISHEIPYYRAYLKNAVLNGAYIVNNPFWWSADDKFFNYSLAEKLGVAVPKTVILPSNQHPPNTTSESMRNLVFPIDWKSHFDYLGFPNWMKPFDGGGWKHVYKIENPLDFFMRYNQTGDICMVLQEGIEFDEYYRCYCVGKKHVHIMPYEPRNPHADRYKAGFSPSAKMTERITKDCITLCTALGYDLNTVEFAVRDGVPYAIDFMNPAPDADYASVGIENFNWIVTTMTAFLIEKAEEVKTKGSSQAKEFHWATFLNGK
jgi:glutathione synthase/RimK-type ligase-like ATP-grasp enzyme